MSRVAQARQGAALLLGAAGWLLSSAATAQPTLVPPAGEQERVRVTYVAPAGCPPDAEFQERVRSRVQRAHFAEPGELARAFDVTVSAVPEDAGFLGRLEFVDTDGQRASRSLKGAACDELASSLALITALAIDDRIAEAPPGEASPEPSPPPAEKSTPTQKTNAEVRAPPRLPEPPDRSPPVASPLRWELGLNVGVLSWVTASAAPELGLYAELRSRLPSWSVRLSAFDARRSKTNPDVGSADFVADWLRLEACPVALDLRAHFSLTPCAAFDAGQLRGTARTEGAKPQDILWAAGVALVRLSWVYRERLVLGGDAELGVPVTHRDFRIQNPDGSVLNVPNFGVGAKFGLGVRFP
ncbi:MAG: hypothetical protein ABUL62_09155 [Myxococcales bacterium]